MWDGLNNAPRHLFFTGKGGVGKTSLACASALALADRGRRVLLVSTDPASNLDEVLGVTLEARPKPVPGVPGLCALNINPLAAAQAYRARLVDPFRGKLPEALLRTMEEQLSGACTTEIAAFDEFTRLLGNPDLTASFDHVVFDTAPTGHTLRLLALPGAWSDFMATNTTGASCLGPLAGLRDQQAVYQRALASLQSPQQTLVVLVSRAQRAPLREAERTSEELAALGIRAIQLIINGRFRTHAPGDSAADAIERREREALAEYHTFLAKWPVTEIRLRAHNLLGLDALRELTHENGTMPDLPPSSPPAGHITEFCRDHRRSVGRDGIDASARRAVQAHETFTSSGPDRTAADPVPPEEVQILGDAHYLTLPACETLTALVDQIAAPGRGVVMTMGKGGVGKTTLAAAIAGALAQRGHPVLLSTTDPAAHVEDALGARPGLRIQAINPARETEAYRAHVLASAGRDLDAQGRALLEEDLRSPCTEEIAVFQAFARTVAEGTSGFVVLDTAPTGHTLLLLDATEAYHREVSRHGPTLPEEVRELLPRLRDPTFTRVLVVTLPEATPVHEAAQLQQDLIRAGITPFAWIINQSLARLDTCDPLLALRGRNEEPYIREVVNGLATRTVRLPWLPREPRGADGLAQLLDDEIRNEVSP